jgi:hypothetical protein
MEIKVNDKIVLTLTDTQIKVLCDQIFTENITEDIERRVAWSIQHAYEETFARLKAEWDIKLHQLGFDLIPTDKDKYAQLIFSQPSYKTLSERATPNPTTVWDIPGVEKPNLE